MLKIIAFFNEINCSIYLHLYIFWFSI